MANVDVTRVEDEESRYHIHLDEVELKALGVASAFFMHTKPEAIIEIAEQLGLGAKEGSFDTGVVFALKYVLSGIATAVLDRDLDKSVAH